jgi:hypothetical protein
MQIKFLLVKLKLKEKNEVHHGNGTWICNNFLKKSPLGIM